MRRILKALVAVLALALAIPGVALAHGHRGHHAGRHTRGAHHRRHHHRHHAGKHARIMRFRPSVATAAEGEEGEEGTGAEEGAPAPESAGVVVSFEGEVLAIELNDGSVVKGKLTEDTHLLCMSMEAAEAAEAEEGEEGESSEDRGSGDGSEGGDRSEGAEAEGAEGDKSSGDESSGDESSGGDEGSSEASGDGSPSAHDSSFDGPSHDGWWGGGAMQPCETTALTPGTTVRGAELRLGSAGAVWEKVILLQ